MMRYDFVLVGERRRARSPRKWVMFEVLVLMNERSSRLRLTNPG
jgi:hypothetical protein